MLDLIRVDSRSLTGVFFIPASPATVARIHFFP